MGITLRLILLTISGRLAIVSAAKAFAPAEIPTARPYSASTERASLVSGNSSSGVTGVI